MPAADSDFRHNELLIGFKPIDDLHREFQDILDALTDPTEADFGKDLRSWFQDHAQTEDAELAAFLKGNPG